MNEIHELKMSGGGHGGKVREPVSIWCRSLGTFGEVVSPRSNFRPSLSISSIVNSSLKTMCDKLEAMQGKGNLIGGKKSITVER